MEWRLCEDYMQEDNQAIRINKFLSDAGVCSRREADRLLEQGKIYVDGKVATKGQKVFNNQKIECNGKIVSRENDLILLAFSKNTYSSASQNLMCIQITWRSY